MSAPPAYAYATYGEAVPISVSLYATNTALVGGVQTVFSVTIPPVPVIGLRIVFTDLLITVPGTSSVTVATFLVMTGFNLSRQFSFSGTPTVTIPAGGYRYFPINTFISQGNAGADLTAGGTIALQANPITSGSNLYFSYMVIEGYFGGLM